MTAFYLASRYSRREEMLGVRDVLEALGHNVTSRWLDGSHQGDPDDTVAMHAFAREDFLDIARSDVLIAFTETPREPSTNRGGRHVELGIALALGRNPLGTIVCGPVENAFCMLADVRVADWPRCVMHITNVYGYPQGPR